MQLRAFKITNSANQNEFSRITNFSIRGFVLIRYNISIIRDSCTFVYKMKIIVKAKPNAKEDKVEKIDEHNFLVSVKAPPMGGKANAEIIKLLAEHFGINRGLVEIISGHMARVKVVEISNE